MEICLWSHKNNKQVVVVRSLIIPAFSVAKRGQLICSPLHIGKKCTPRPLVWMSFTLTLIFWENTVISVTLGKRLSCHHQSRKKKRAKRWRIDQLCSKGCSVQRLYRRFGELFFILHIQGFLKLSVCKASFFHKKWHHSV